MSGRVEVLASLLFLNSAVEFIYLASRGGEARAKDTPHTTKSREAGPQNMADSRSRRQELVEPEACAT